MSANLRWLGGVLQERMTGCDWVDVPAYSAIDARQLGDIGERWEAGEPIAPPNTHELTLSIEMRARTLLSGDHGSIAWRRDVAAFLRELIEPVDACGSASNQRRALT